MPIHIGHRPDHDVDQPLGLLSDCHRRIEHFLDVLVALDRQAAGGPLSPERRLELESALAYFATAAPKHTADEEESVFPRLRTIDHPSAGLTAEILARLERDHVEADRHQEAVDALGRAWLDRGRLEPDEAGALREHLAALQALYQQHIGIEDRELFPLAARLLSPAQIVELGREMAARRRHGVTP